MPNRNQFNSHEEYLAWYKEYQHKPKIREYRRKYITQWRIEHKVKSVKVAKIKPMRNITAKEAGLMGAEKRWAKRYEMLKELSKYTISKDEQNRMLKLKTKTLDWIMRTIEFIKNDK